MDQGENSNTNRETSDGSLPVASSKRPGPKAKSAVWSFFKKVDDEESKARCDICSEKFKHSSNTTNLFKHLKAKHPKEYEIAETQRREDEEKSKKPKRSNMRQKTLFESVPSAKYSSTSSKRKSIDAAVFNMIMKDLQPVSVVEDEGFQLLLHTLDPRYQIPSRKSIMRMLPEKYSDKCATVKEELSRQSYVALTSDLWTSRATESYLTITCHFLTSSWELKSFVLDTFQFEESHTAENISAVFLKCAEKWNISGKIIAIVTDNASNIVAAVRLTGWNHVPCFAHTVNLVVSDAIKEDKAVSVLKKKCKQIVTYFHQSVKATEKLKEIQRQQNLPEHKLIQEVDTRWNSTFYMFERIAEQREAIITALCFSGRNDLCLTVEDVRVLESAISVLKPFETATREISSDTYISISKAIPLARSLQHIAAESSRASEESSQLSSLLSSQMRRRFTGIENAHLLALSTLLDPRLKKLAFSNRDAARQGEQWILQEIKNSISVESTTEDSNVDKQPEKAPGLWDLFDRKVADTQSTRSVNNRSSIEIQSFFAGNPLPRHEDPLEWWNENERRFGLLAPLAKKYLCIPGTSVPSERLFSKTGELISARRNRLKPKNVDMMIFLNQNL